jgi:hypothetical protein
VRYTPGWIEELTTRASGWATLGLRSDAGGEQSSMSAESAYCPGVATCVFAMLAKWFSLTRLETRTKESNVYASIWVFKTLVRNESKGCVCS